MAGPARSWVPTVALLAVGIVAIGGLAWWALGGAERPVVVPPAQSSQAMPPTPSRDDEDGLRALLRSPAVLVRGKVVFDGLCYTCHGPHGEGTTLGPNLRDDHWINGSDMRDLVRIISDGKPATTAMQPMRNLYPASDIAAVAAYVVTLKGGSAGSDKAPEGPAKPIFYWP